VPWAPPRRIMAMDISESAVWKIINGSIDGDLSNWRNGILLRNCLLNICLIGCRPGQDNGNWKGPTISGKLFWSATDSSTVSTPVSFNRVCEPNILSNVRQWPSSFSGLFPVSIMMLLKDLIRIHLPFLVDLVSFIYDIEYTESDSNWQINNLSNIIMIRRYLDATERILWDFISGHLMHPHLIVPLDPRSVLIVTIKTWPLSSWLSRTLFSVDRIFFSADRTNCFYFLGKYGILYQKHPFSVTFQFGLKEIVTRERNISRNFW
jgi:hypothetical protein